MHYANQCPHSLRKESAHVTEDVEEDVEEVELVLLTEVTKDQIEEVELVLMSEHQILDKQEIFVAEASKSAVIDTACTKTVGGEIWLDDYVESLTLPQLEETQYLDSATKFKFGDGRHVTAVKKAIIPVEIAGRKCKIEMEVVKENIPLLLSKSSLKKLDALIDIKNDRAQILGKDIDLKQTSSGHYCLDICQTKESSNDVSKILLTEKVTSKSDVVKLHKQFGHATAENLRKLLTNSGISDKNVLKLVDEVVDNCLPCITHKRRPARPAVGLPRAYDFNHQVAMDLHQLEPKLWFMHIIDEFSRYSNAIIIRHKDESVKVFMKCWISLFGAPKKVFSDNGGEFICDEFINMCDAFGITVSTTPTCAPWSNGICERHNQTLTNMLLKIKDDTKGDWETCLAWAVSAKNALINYNGFSPMQIVFGRNPNLPSTIGSPLPAMEEPGSKTVAMHLAALNSARQSFIKSESSEKIKRALRKQTRKWKDTYQIGDKVYYKREDESKWTGPAKVLGQDGPVVFIRHGSRYVKAHVCRVQPTEINAVNGEETEPQQPTSNSEISRRTKDIVNDTDDEVDDEDDITLIDSAGDNVANNDAQEESQSDTGKYF